MPIVELPAELVPSQLPMVLQDRLRLFLDKQDKGENLNEVERREAEGLVSVAELLSLLKVKSQRVK
jgi:hypothetical protein